MSESKHHWSAEKNGNYDPPWILRYDPTPSGLRNEDGSTTHSLNFPALQLTDWVGEPEKAANEIAQALNRNDELRAEVERLRAAAEPLCRQWRHFADETYGNQENAYYTLAKGQSAHWERLCAALRGEDG